MNIAAGRMGVQINIFFKFFDKNKLIVGTVNVLKFPTLYFILFLPKFCCCFFVQLFLKMISGMANSVDPDQTAPSGAVWSGLHCLHMPFCQKLWCTKFVKTFAVMSRLGKHGCRGTSNEYSQHMFSWRNEKNIYVTPLYIWSLVFLYVTFCFEDTLLC